MGISLGRPSAIQDEEYVFLHRDCHLITHVGLASIDVELPAECDDEYWVIDDKKSFKQPADKPSRISYFICFIQLTQILAFALRTIVIYFVSYTVLSDDLHSSLS